MMIKTTMHSKQDAYRPQWPSRGGVGCVCPSVCVCAGVCLPECVCVCWGVSARVCVCVLGGVCLGGCTLNREQNHRQVSKHYLSATTVVDGKN